MVGIRIISYSIQHYPTPSTSTLKPTLKPTPSTSTLKPTQSNSLKPTRREPFWTCDSKELEVIYQNLKSDPSSGSKTVTPIMNDGLFEVNVATREIYPIYWDGPVYEVRRGVWFEPKGIHFEIESYQKGIHFQV